MFVLPENSNTNAFNCRAVYDQLRLACAEHAHLRQYEPQVAFLLRLMPKTKQGRRVLGSVHMPRVNGELSKLFDYMLEDMFGYAPEFLVILDNEFWTEESTEKEREILMFHEMCHMAIAEDEHGAQRFYRESGTPVWTIRGHDIEEFNEVVARYGAWSGEVQAFIAAVRSGNNG